MSECSLAIGSPIYLHREPIDFSDGVRREDRAYG